MSSAARKIDIGADADVLPGVPADWAELIAGLGFDGPADCFNIERLAAMVYDADAMLSMWRGELLRLEWSALDLFGVHPTAPEFRFDAMGLVPMLHGGSVRYFTKQTAVFASRYGSELTFRRTANPTSVLIWNLGRSAALLQPAMRKASS